MRRIVHVLTANLYKSSPTRQIAGEPAATELLERIYRRNAMLPMWQAADKLAHVGDLCRSSSPARPTTPARCGSTSRAPSSSSGGSTRRTHRPMAVGTLDYRDNRRHLTLWTAESLRVYATDKRRPSSRRPAARHTGS